MARRNAKVSGVDLGLFLLRGTLRILATRRSDWAALRGVPLICGGIVQMVAEMVKAEWPGFVFDRDELQIFVGNVWRVVGFATHLDELENFRPRDSGSQAGSPLLWGTSVRIR